MGFVSVQFLPGKNGGGCLSTVDLDNGVWDKAKDLKGSLCVRPDQAHNSPDNPDVQRLITAWTEAGVTWISVQETLARGYRVTPPFYYFPETDKPDFAIVDGIDPLDPLAHTLKHYARIDAELDQLDFTDPPHSRWAAFLVFCRLRPAPLNWRERIWQRSSNL